MKNKVVKFFFVVLMSLLLLAVIALRLHMYNEQDNVEHQVPQEEEVVFSGEGMIELEVENEKEPEVISVITRESIEEMLVITTTEESQISTSPTAAIVLEPTTHIQTQATTVVPATETTVNSSSSAITEFEVEHSTLTQSSSLETFSGILEEELNKVIEEKINNSENNFGGSTPETLPHAAQEFFSGVLETAEMLPDEVVDELMGQLISP